MVFMQYIRIVVVYIRFQGSYIQYKGRSYAWIEISPDGMIVLTDEMMAFLNLDIGMKLLSIRSSNIAFTMGAYGRLMDESMKHENEIPVY